MNKSDSERIATILEKKGNKPAKDEKQANLIIINVCSIRQRVIDKIYGRATSFKGKKVILTGCVLDRDKEKFNKIPWVDVKNFKEQSQIDLKSVKCFFETKPKYKFKKSAFIPIMEGCDNFCSYCAVPYTRGREFYRKEKNILNEAKILIKKGFKEITLLGQNVNSYPDFPKLLEKIAKIPGNFKLTFMTSHPKDFSDELINIIAKSKKIKNYVHLPVQSGDNEILKKMNRNYTREKYLKLIKKIRKKILGVEITTDIIVGFPGETKKQFQNTVDLIKKSDFSLAYISRYSPRSGTAAEKLKNNISEEEKQKRAKIIRETINKINKN